MKLATLGPPGTYSDVVATMYQQQPGVVFGARLVYYSHLQRCLQALPDEADYAVVPIENISEGFVPVVLDYLVSADLHIVSEHYQSIEFSACGAVQDLTACKRLYVQFVASGQCRDFIDALGDVEILTTQSNSESLLLAAEYGQGAVAIVPNHLLADAPPETMPWRQANVHDYSHNATRFLLLAPGPAQVEDLVEDDGIARKTSLMVMNDNDRPGLLEQVLHCFSTRRLNLSSIVSRPTGQGFGQYHFFMDVEASLNNIAMQGALRALQQITRVKVLGCYG